ncbi:nicotinamide/nicotinic acid mononucleotide adenylyltransferase 1 isoform X1 [Ceratitis capitata]|uniref:Nicotinamide-nucleotide adenylyltransferase n=1 Tax=Ceratitis capitata TaxID=7213 RepID=A0A811U8C1_CERCA|nr:nicotinamide/nicotinic acid mononucleotide adenylyltransferase 1 isoform X1 [Ceratitis capitata]CAD6993603.1 unnamed protein product [Ceratitis capitata]
MSKQNNFLPRLILIACGSYSPPTSMHLRMFEIARNHFMERGMFRVIGGIISPVHDEQHKQGLVGGEHRLAMLKLALRSSNWIRLSDWELRQTQWTPTVDVLKYHKHCIEYAAKTERGEAREGDYAEWLPAELCACTADVQLRFLLGSDLLETLADTKLWSNEEIESLCNYGLVVLTRIGSKPDKFVFESDILSKYCRNIEFITNWTTNNLSSTLVRRLLRRGQSVKYLLDDDVIEYINKHNLYR